ncbi:MAG: phage tail protein, partial [Pseudomonadota bacterium]
MGQTLAGIAGAVVGFAIGGPAGAQIGFAVGSGAYSLLNPQQISGPKLSDTKVQISSYGAALGMVYGGWRKAGNVIWAADLQEVESTSSGKGGPEITTTSYTASFAVALAETEHEAVRRIWAGGKLIYDITDSDDGPGQAASAAFASYFTFYSGSEAQLPDPTLEAVFGAGNVPAFRGVCYMVFTDLPVGAYGNTLPQLQVELTNNEPAVDADEVLAPLTLGPWTGSEQPAHSLGDTTYSYPADGSLYQGPSLGAAVAAMQADKPWAATYIGYYTSTEDVLSPFSGAAAASLADGAGARFVYLAYNYEQPSVVVDGFGDGSTDLQWCTPLACEFDNAVMAQSFPPGVGTASVGHTGIARLFPGGETVGFPYGTVSGFDGFGANCTGCPPEGGLFPVSRGIRHVYIKAERALTPPAQTCEPGDPCLLGIAQIPGNSDYCINCDGDISQNLQYTVESGSFLQLQAADIGSFEVFAYPLGPLLRASDPLNTEAFWEAAALEAGVSGTYGVDYPVVMTEAAVAVGTNAEVAAGSILLADLVEDICLRTRRLTAEQLELSALNDVVLGYGIGKQASARANLEPLRQAFFFDLIESEGLIKAVKRGGAAVATIGPDDLGAGEDEPAPYLAQPVRTQEAELPATLVVAYVAAATDYQTGTQRERRITTASEQQLGVELPVVMTDLKAAEVAAVLMYDAWVGRTMRTWATTRAWCHLEPGDLVNLNDGTVTVLVRIVDKLEAGPVIEWLSVDEDVAAYTPNVSPALTAGGGSAIRFEGPTKLELFDSPILQDSDDNAGYYAAASGYRSEWSGGRVFRSPDGVSYSTLQDFNVAATLGYAQTVLGDWAGGNTVDETNTVTVRVHSGTLVSVTDAQLLAGANGALLGREVIQFRTATLVGAGVYTLSGLLRGRRGTEWATGTHAEDESFALIQTTGLKRIGMDASELDVEYIYKAVTFGQALADAAEKPFTNTGVGKKPFAPVDLRAGTLPGTQDIGVTWNRRSRLSGRLLSPVPLGEATEAYEIDVFDLGTDELLRTLPAVGPSLLYTAAQQGEDGVTQDTSLRFDVYQLSAVVGRGYGASIVASGARGALPQLVTFTLGGSFASGAGLYAVLGSDRYEYTSVGGDTDLAGISTSFAAVIDAATDYAAAAVGPVIMVSGPVSEAFPVSAGQLSGGSALVLRITQEAADVRPGAREQYYVGWGSSTTWFSPIGTTFTLRLRRTTDGLVLLYRAYAVRTDAFQARQAQFDVVNAFNASGDREAYDLAVSFNYLVETMVVFTPLAEPFDWEVEAYCTEPTIDGLVGRRGTGAEPIDAAQPQIITATVSGPVVTGRTYRLTLGGVAYD